MSRAAEEIRAAVLVMDERITRLEATLARLESFTVRTHVAQAIARAGSDQAVAKLWKAFGPAVAPLDQRDRVALWKRAVARTAKLRGGSEKAAREWLTALLEGAKEAEAQATESAVRPAAARGRR